MECITIQNDKKCNSENEASRLSYVERISCFSEIDFELPSADEARSFDEALAHVVRLFPNKGVGDSTALFTELKACRRRKASLKDSLTGILDALRWMERKRLYDPPADDEIGFYLLIKKYVRAIFTSFSVRTGLDQMYGELYGCGSYFYTLHLAEELVELNRYFADYSAFVSEVNIEDGSVIKPLMGIGDNYEVPPLFRGSKDRSNKFYHHKFVLALSDIRTLESSIFPPFAEEERSYLRVLDHISSHPSTQTKDEVSVYSEELYQLFLEKVVREASDMARHCTSMRKSLLDKISMPESWEYLKKMYDEDPKKEFVELGRKLAEKCRVPHTIAIKKYIMSVERCRDIAHGVSLIVDELLSRGCEELNYPTYYPDTMTRFGWEALHVLTLLKHGSFSSGNVFRENVLLQDSMSGNVRMKLEPKAANMGLKRCAQGSDNENATKKLKCKEEEAKIGLKRCAQGSENENVDMKLKCKEEAKMKLKRCAHVSENENVKKKLKKEAQMGLKRCAQVSENENVKKLKCKEEAHMGLKQCAQGSESENVKKKKLKFTGVQMGLKGCGLVSENENVRVLRGIVGDLRCIGDADILPDTEEYALMYKIWYSVATSVHFFFSAMAYEQRRCVTRRGGSLDIRKIGLRRTKKMKNCTDVIELRNKAYQVMNLLYDISYEMEQLTGILHAYGRGLSEQLESQIE